MGLEIINQIKKEKGLTSKQLAEKSKVPIGTLNKILNGQTKNPAYETILSLATVLECPVDIFCTNTAENNFSDIENMIRKQLSKEELTLLEDYNKLDDEDKVKVSNYTKDLSNNIKYIDKKNNITKLINDTEKEQHIGMAAHNDFAHDEEQQKLMQEDLDEL